jgi:hypothetical protein
MSTAGLRSWVRWWAMGGGAVLLALGWWMWHRASVEGAAPALVPRSAQSIASPTPAPSEQVAALGLDHGEALFQTLLLPDGGIGAIQGSVRVGIAKVSSEDAASYREWLDSGAEGAGPADPSELATVEQWIAVPAHRRPDGTVEVGPFNLPAAHRYDLLAQAEDDLHVYAASFTRASMPASIGPRLAAGLRIHHSVPNSGRAQLVLRRSAELPNAETWQAVMQQLAPDVLAAFGDEPLTLGATVQSLAPLPPSPIEVLLLIDGIEAGRRTVALQAGVISDLRFDPVAQGVAQAVSVNLQLRFVVRDTGVAIADIRVTHHGDQGEQQRVSDQTGGVHFSNLDRQRPHNFTLRFPVDENELPTWPEEMPLEVSLEARSDESTDQPVVERRIDLSPLHWLLVRTGTLPKESRRQVGNPYPIFLLQRQAADGTWQDTASDHFMPVSEGLAVSCAERGRYRVMGAVSPWTVHLSTTADTRIAAQDHKYRVDLTPQLGHSVDLVLQRDGVPLASTPVQFQGPARGLPPRTLTTDSRGRLRLDDVTREEVVVEIPGSDEIRVDVSGTVAAVDLAGNE